MSLLIPLGLLGLSGLLILLLIYILKPNYQQKLISSTYVWKLSLKYKKKRLPISRLRNLLILLCQILIICCGALIMAQPALVNDTTVYADEKIAVIDASASMRSSYDNETRFERAVERVKALADEVFAKNGILTVINAGRSAEYVAQRVTASEYGNLMESLDLLECSYGEGDVEGALGLAEEVLNFNSDAEVVLYSANYVCADESVRVENVAVDSEWNIAILNATAEMVDNFYVFTVDVACYGRDGVFDLSFDVVNVNGTANTTSFPTRIECNGNETLKVVYAESFAAFGSDVHPVTIGGNERVFSFGHVYVHIDENDTILTDNEFYIYGGEKPTVKIQYYSTNPNNFFNGNLLMLQGMFGSRWNVEIKEVNKGTPETSGYDFYIFEHKMPLELPKDGIVLMSDPDKSADAGFSLGRKVSIPDWDDDGAVLSAGKDHPILTNLDVSSFRLTEYAQVREDSLDGYDVLMYYEGNPVFFVKDEPDAKIAVMPFNIHMSNFGLSFYFPVLMYNLFDYFFPATFADSVYNVYDTVTLNARAEELTVSGLDEPVKNFPADFVISEPGTYTVSQKLMSGATLTERFYARIPASQSNIKRADILPGIQSEIKTGISYDGLLLWFAAAIVALLFLEWFLQSRNGI